MARPALDILSSRRFLALAFVAIAAALFALDNWPAETRVSQTGGDVAAADADLAGLPVMYE